MKPSARIAASIEILDEIIACASSAELVVRRYLRNRRFIGSKDRKAIQELTFGVIRNRGALAWYLAKTGRNDCVARELTIAHLALDQGQPTEQLIALFDGDKYAPPALAPGERELLAACAEDAGADWAAAAPEWARLNYPAWLDRELKRSLEPDFAAEMAALNEQAPVDFRVNTLRATRGEALAKLSDAGIDAAASPWSPHGIRLARRTPLGVLEAYREGLIEPQDEGSQILAMVADATQGQTVIDLCAGAGGKTLALGAAMANKGRLIATDLAPDRLARATQRLRRAGVEIAEPMSDLEDVHRDFVAAADRVLIDAPCSGSGAWRRQPAARWCLSGEKLDRLHRVQAELLTRAAKLVKPGGRLVYATCSVLRCENEDQADRFESQITGYRRLDVAEIWQQLGPVPPPFGGPCLALTPSRHNTDGVFAAVWERAA